MQAAKDGNTKANSNTTFYSVPSTQYLVLAGLCLRDQVRSALLQKALCNHFTQHFTNIIGDLSLSRNPLPAVGTEDDSL